MYFRHIEMSVIARKSMNLKLSYKAFICARDLNGPKTRAYFILIYKAKKNSLKVNPARQLK